MFPVLLTIGIILAANVPTTLRYVITTRKEAPEEQERQFSNLMQPHVRNDETKNKKRQSFLTSGDSNRRSSIGNNRTRRNIPNVLFIGAQKAGTTALSQYLFENANVCALLIDNNPTSAVDTAFQNTKESHFFDLHFHRGLSYYQKLYQHCSNNTVNTRIVMDATPNHMRFPDRVKQIYEQHGILSELKVFMVLREPVQREISAYKHRVYFHQNDPAAIAATEDKVIDEVDGSIMPFEKTMNLQVIPQIINGTMSVSNHLHGRSFYAYWLRRWFDLFDRNNILVLSYDEIKANSDDAVRRLMQFLSLPEPKESMIELERLNDHYHGVATKGTRSWNISCSFQRQLYDFFEPLNQELYQLLEDHPGPDMETRPFPQFRFACK
jgi:Sulfotransferase domain.